MSMPQKPVLDLGYLKLERGAVSIIVAFVTFSLLAVAALVIDIGLLYQERRQLQTAADSAALAGITELAEGRSMEEAQATAESYVLQNANVTPDQILIDFPGANQIKVTCSTTRKLFIAPIFGEKQSSVETTATATFGSATSVRNLVPIIVPIQEVVNHIGEGNAAYFELGEDRPEEAFTKTGKIEQGQIKYTISYINTSNGPENITITDPLSNNALYINGSATGGGVYDPSTNTLIWTFSGVAAGDNRTVTFYAQAPSIDNTAYLKTSSSPKTVVAKANEDPQKGFFWLCDFNAGSSTTPELDSWIRNGYPEEVSIGFVANGEGVRASLKDALGARQAHDPKVVLPLYNYTEDQGNNGKYHVVGFAEFMITGFSLNGQPKNISGYFTNGTVTAGSADGTPPDDEFGVQVIWLID
jgi:uncharacterized repeat protein (TIGR01451 family)